jgi:predicted nucleic acid-binding protein
MPSSLSPYSTIMQEQGVSDALTADEHFIQAGFRAVMR